MAAAGVHSELIAVPPELFPPTNPPSLTGLRYAIVRNAGQWGNVILFPLSLRERAG